MNAMIAKDQFHTEWVECCLDRKRLILISQQVESRLIQWLRQIIRTFYMGLTTGTMSNEETFDKLLHVVSQFRSNTSLLQSLMDDLTNVLCFARATPTTMESLYLLEDLWEHVGTYRDTKSTMVPISDITMHYR